VLTLLTAAVLFEFATAQPKGFAFTLILGVLVSMFTAVVATRALLGLLADFSFFDRAAFMGVKASDIHTVEAEPGRRRGAGPARPRPATVALCSPEAPRRPRLVEPSRQTPFVDRPKEEVVNWFRKIYSFDYMGHKYLWFAFSAPSSPSA